MSFLKAWFFGARKVQSSIIQSDKNHFEESREREDWFEWFTTILDLAVTCFKKNRGERMTVWCEIRAKNDISEGTYCTIVWRGMLKKGNKRIWSQILIWYEDVHLYIIDTSRYIYVLNQDRRCCKSTFVLQQTIDNGQYWQHPKKSKAEWKLCSIPE